MPNIDHYIDRALESLYFSAARIDEPLEALPHRGDGDPGGVAEVGERHGPSGYDAGDQPREVLVRDIGRRRRPG